VSACRGWTLDFSTLVIDPKYADVPGVEYYDVDTDQGHFKFAQGHAGVLPELLKDLATFRKSAKKKMAEAKARGDTFAAALHNGEQLAFKVTMNSAYGFTGATKGFLSCVPIAASVTATGRQMIAKTKGLVEQMLPGSRVVYGVSGRPANDAQATLWDNAHTTIICRTRIPSCASSTWAPTTAKTWPRTWQQLRNWRTTSPRPSRRPWSWSSKRQG
jgi:hypothetical protein